MQQLNSKLDLIRLRHLTIVVVFMLILEGIDGAVKERLKRHEPVEAGEREGVGKGDEKQGRVTLAPRRMLKASVLVLQTRLTS